MSKVVVVALSVVVAAVAARTAAQQMPRDRTATEQRAGELADFERKLAELEKTAAQRPGDAAARHLIGTFFMEKARDPSLSADEKRAYITRGLAAEEKAL